MPNRKSLKSIITALKAEERRLSSQRESLKKKIEHIDAETERVRSAIAILENKSPTAPLSLTDNRHQSAEPRDTSLQIANRELTQIVSTLLSDISDVRSELTSRVREAGRGLEDLEPSPGEPWTLRAFHAQNDKRA